MNTMKSQLQNYPLIDTTISLENNEVQLTIIGEPDWFLEQLSREDNEGRLHLPYWTYLWEASIGLACHLEKLGEQVSNPRLQGSHILEIGCGFGLAGIVACLVGAKVVFTDSEQEALLFAQHNAQQNAVANLANFVQMDWNAPCFRCKFNHILASDVIYEEHHWKPILDLLHNLLASNGIALFSEPNRNNALGFFKFISTNGFTYQKSTRLVAMAGKTTKVSIYTVQRANVGTNILNL